MASKTAKSLEEVLSGGRLAALGEEARQRRVTTELIRRRLPAEAAPHLVSARRAADGGLVLTMDAAAWAARVRYLGEHLGATRISVKVSPKG